MQWGTRMGSHPHDRNRRRLLAAMGTAGVTVLAGCSTLGFGDESGVSESFDSGTLGSFQDASQDSVSPTVLNEYARSGSHALHLGSQPGTSTRSEVRHTNSVTPPVTCEAWVRKYRDDGDENNLGLALRDVDSEGGLVVADSGYHGGAHVLENDAAGERVRDANVGPELSLNEWHRLSITVNVEGTVTAGVNERSVTYQPEFEWANRTLRPALVVNAWGNGDALAAAFDDFHLERTA